MFLGFQGKDNVNPEQNEMNLFLFCVKIRFLCKKVRSASWERSRTDGRSLMDHDWNSFN
ncbi:hypothetical protein HMPREF9446_01999 [Bacteroides fluxus YIT 12057]|uniref:Uncharacterized protein n=1 Tax=Bacteroides fluxus YIT 12057 TaxID=763034 RepID=F3PTD1_9BACE|nr:hypothetical protein HMPREF9446_01999 [Bacteroides fluxus YIT 12057]